MKPTSEYSIMTTSIANMTPAIGVLKDAAMEAAVPHATNVLKLLFGSLNSCPSKLLLAAPTWTTGPSRPTE